jgi:hypothetical protein
MVGLDRANSRAQQRGDVPEWRAGGGLGNAGAAADQVQPGLGAGDGDGEQAGALAGEAGPVGAGLGHPPPIGVVLDKVEHHHVELAALEAVRGADLGGVAVVGLVVAERLQGGLGLVTVRGDHADTFTKTAVVVGQDPGQQRADRPPPARSAGGPRYP